MESDLFIVWKLIVLHYQIIFALNLLYTRNKEGRRTDKDLATNNCQKLCTHVESNYFVLKFVVNTMLFIL